ncbi:MAG: biotin--[acetyl-CoA-carboxylase] ligase [Thaumarchaeota archaeon]|nr:biotin--[acetyl-CoA-carboxylase] ligase [Nitrososphaerota archaeon]
MGPRRGVEAMESRVDGSLGEAVAAMRRGSVAGVADGTLGELRRLGYRIDVSGAGARVVGGSDLLLPWELARGLQTRLLGRRAEYHAEIGSTQDRAVGLARAGGADGTVVAAGTQSCGRGRSGRRWESPAGGLWMSVVLGRVAGNAGILPLAASLALSGALLGALGERTGLVWPNDIVVDRGGEARKVAGIAVDAEASGGALEGAVVGIGVNLNVDEAALDASIRGAVRRAASVHGGDRAAARVAQSFLLNMELLLPRMGDGARIAGEWERRSGIVGSRVDVRTDPGEVSGTVSGIGPDGELVLCCGGEERRLAAGEVLRVAPARGGAGPGAESR